MTDPERKPDIIESLIDVVVAVAGLAILLYLKSVLIP
jgi:hypothetical protein